MLLQAKDAKPFLREEEKIINLALPGMHEIYAVDLAMRTLLVPSRKQTYRAQ